MQLKQSGKASTRKGRKTKSDCIKDNQEAERSKWRGDKIE